MTTILSTTTVLLIVFNLYLFKRLKKTEEDLKENKFKLDGILKHFVR